MSNNSKFEELRHKLLVKVRDCEKPSDIENDFIQNFMRLVELCTFSLMNSEENFFAHFMIQMKRAVKLDMPTATGISASVSCFTIYFNPAIFLHCSFEEMKALIKHEIYHIMYSHLKRAALLRKKYSVLAVNKAMDITVNQYIKNLPAFMDTLPGVSMSYNVNLRPDGTLEEYTKTLQEAADRLKEDKDNKHQDNNWNDKNHDIVYAYDAAKAHEIWDMSEDTLNFEQIDELTKKTANNANKGKIPSGMGPLLKALNEKPEISWAQYLKKILGTMPSGHRKTITRKDRRQPERLDLRGRLSDHASNIAVAIDISGSMSSIEIEQAMKEIFSIVKFAESKVTIIECDSNIRRVYKAKNKSDIRQKLNTNGGTRFSPVFKYMRENGMRNYLLIYFTDGIGEDDLEIIPSHHRTLWVLTGKGEKLSLIKPYGEVKRLSNIKLVEQDLDYAKNEMRDILVEWQK